MIPIINLNSLTDIFPVKGWYLESVADKVPEGADYQEVVITLSHENNRDSRHDVRFYLPLQDINGIIKIGATSRIIIAKGLPGAEYCLHPNMLSNVWIASPIDQVRAAIRDALHMAIISGVPQNSDLNPINEELLQDKLARFFSTGDSIRYVDPGKPIDVEFNRSAILFDVASDKLDYQERRFTDWRGKIDIISTSQGKHAGLIYRGAKGASIESRRIKGSDNVFCRSMEKYLLFPENNRPDRLLMTRSVLAKHDPLVHSEDPLAAHISYDSKLKGRHFVTGVASHPLTFYDSIVVSESAAYKMACTKIVRQVFITNKKYKKVYTSGYVVPSTILLECDGEVVTPTKLKVASAELIDYSSEHTLVGRTIATRHTFTFRCLYPLRDGDKLSSRHSSKGVVTIIPDKEMKKYTIVTLDGTVVPEVLIHPRSLVGRRNLGVFREMMANKRCVHESTTLRTEHFSFRWSFNELVSLGYGNPYNISENYNVRGKMFVGPLYWLRPDKHAVEQLSVMGIDKPIDIHGMNPDSGRAGQRMGPDVAMVMKAKGMDWILKTLMRKSIEPGAIARAKQILGCLAHATNMEEER